MMTGSVRSEEEGTGEKKCVYSKLGHNIDTTVAGIYTDKHMLPVAEHVILFERKHAKRTMRVGWKTWSMASNDRTENK